MLYLYFVIVENTRENAETELSKLKKINNLAYQQELLKQMSDESNPPDVRQMAGIMFKNSVDVWCFVFLISMIF
jgi:hypothetical protein